MNLVAVLSFAGLVSLFLFKTDILDLATVDTAVKLETVGSRSVLSISTRCQVGRLILWSFNHMC